MQKHLRIFLILSLLFFVVFTPSCRKTEETEALVFPDILLRDATYLLGRSDEEDILFKAKEIDIYIDDEKAELKDSEFEQKKENSQDLLISGRADEANLNTKTYESSLKGNVHLLLHEDNNSIDADEIVWDKDNGEIVSNGSLTLNYGDVTVSGLDFKGNIKTGVFTFRTIISGIIKGETPPQEEISQEENTPSAETPIPSTQENPESTEVTEKKQIEEIVITPTEEVKVDQESKDETEQTEESTPITPSLEETQETTTETPTSQTEEITTPEETEPIIETPIREEKDSEEDIQSEVTPPTPPSEETPTEETTSEEPTAPETEPTEIIETPTIETPITEEPQEETKEEIPEEPTIEIIPTEIPEPTTPDEEESVVSPKEEAQETTTEATTETTTDENTEQEAQSPTEIEETPTKVETFEPIVDIIVITRDGKIVE